MAIIICIGAGVVLGVILGALVLFVIVAVPEVIEAWEDLIESIERHHAWKIEHEKKRRPKDGED